MCYKDRHTIIMRKMLHSKELLDNIANETVNLRFKEG